MSSLRPEDVNRLRRWAVLGLLAGSGCAPQVVRNPVRLTPANEIALRDGTPVVTLFGYQGNSRGMVSFVFPEGETLVGDAVMNADVNNTMGIWGQAAQTGPNPSSVAMVAIDERQKMLCRGTFSQNATDLTCWFSDGAIYRNVYTAPVLTKSVHAAALPAPAKAWYELW